MQWVAAEVDSSSGFFLRRVSDLPAAGSRNLGRRLNVALGILSRGQPGASLVLQLGSSREGREGCNPLDRSFLLFVPYCSSPVLHQTNNTA